MCYIYKLSVVRQSLDYLLISYAAWAVSLTFTVLTRGSPEYAEWENKDY